MIKGIFFDVGGVLCKSSENSNRKLSFKKVLSDFTNRPLGNFNIRKQGYLWKSSNSKKNLVIQLCKDLKIDDWQTLYQKLSSYSYKISLYEDVEPCLKKLSCKYKLGILSNTTPWTDFDHRELGIGSYINLSILSCRVGMVKPNLEIFAYAQKEIGIKKQELLYVGDNIEYDIKPALKSNWKAILLSRDKNIQKSPAPVISSLSELENTIPKL